MALLSSDGSAGLPATLIVIVTVAMAVIVAAGVAWFVISSMRRVRSFARSTDVVPGRAGTAPPEWTTATSPAALLHRRIRYAAALVHENPGLARHEPTALALQRLDDAIVALDRRLVEAAATHAGPADLQPFDHAATTLERLPGRLVDATVGQARSHMDDVVAYLADPSVPPDPGESAYADERFDD